MFVSPVSPIWNKWAFIYDGPTSLQTSVVHRTLIHSPPVRKTCRQSLFPPNSTPIICLGNFQSLSIPVALENTQKKTIICSVVAERRRKIFAFSICRWRVISRSRTIFRSLNWVIATLVFVFFLVLDSSFGFMDFCKTSDDGRLLFGRC